MSFLSYAHCVMKNTRSFSAELLLPFTVASAEVKICKVMDRTLQGKPCPLCMYINITHVFKRSRASM